MKETIERIKQKLLSMDIQCNEKLDADVIKAFEEKHHITLPEELCALYCEVCNGCTMIDDFPLRPIDEWEFRPEHICEPFPFDEYWIWEDEDDHEEEKMQQTLCGNIELIDIGCAQSWNIIVSGPQKGQMWQFSDVGIQPCAPPKTFLEWFEFWLDGKTDYFEEF